MPGGTSDVVLYVPGCLDDIHLDLGLGGWLSGHLVGKSCSFAGQPCVLFVKYICSRVWLFPIFGFENRTLVLIE